jgi:hypothetical protein
MFDIACLKPVIAGPACKPAAVDVATKADNSSNDTPAADAVEAT